MYLSKIESILQQLKNEPAVTGQIETDIVSICDYYSSIIFAEIRKIMMSNSTDPNEKEYEDIDDAHYKRALKAVTELNDIFVSQGFSPFFSGDVEDTLSLQAFARNLCIELFKIKRGSRTISIEEG